MTHDAVSRGLPLLGHSPWFHADTTRFLLTIARERGDVAEFRLGRRPAFLLAHPAHVEQVLVTDADRFRKGRLIQRSRRLLGDGLITSEDELHRTQRRRIQPAFARQQLLAYSEAVPALATALTQHWNEGATVSISRAMDQLTLSIIAHILLGPAAAEATSPISTDLRILTRWFPVLALSGAQGLDRAGIPPFRQAGRAADRIDRAVQAAIVTAGTAPSSSLLSTMAGAEGIAMTAIQLRDEVMTLLLAGHDTTAAALTWAWYLIAAHPAVADRLTRELDEVLGSRCPVAPDYSALSYTGMIFDEVLRLYPPVGRIGRRPRAAYPLGDITIPEGSAVFLSPYVTQRDPRWWPRPDEFNPDRWATDAAAGRPRYASFPFGAGPRSCIGGHLARMIGVLTIATIARTWQFTTLTSRTPRIRSLLTLKPRGALRLSVSRRHPA